MKAIFKLYLLLLGATFLLTGCEKESSEDQLSQTGENRITFSLQTISGKITAGSPLTRNGINESGIRQLRYVILDHNEQIITPDWQKLSPDFSTLTLESLKDGDYSIVFFATTNPDKEIIQPTEDNGELCLNNPSDILPLDEDYLYKRVDFKIDKNNGSRTINVELERCVGRVEVEVNPVFPYTEYLIRKVEISLNDGNSLYTSKRSKTGNSYSGKGTITDFDITNNRGFYSFPSQAPLSGSVTVESVRYDNTTVKNVYQFSNVVIEEGKVSKIRIDWKSSEGTKGFFRVHESDFTADNSTTMFLDDEPREVFYNQTLRSFSTNKPLQVKVNQNKELQLNFYSPITITDVTILCRFKKYSSEFFKFAHYEKISGFSESRMKIPLVERALTYSSNDGRNVIIPAQPDLSSEDCEFRIESSHPYMAKIATISSPILISFSPYGADEGHQSWRHMTPALCRQACVLAVNYSYMFSNSYFVDKVKNWQGNPLKDNAGRPIPADEVVKRARGVSRLVMGTVLTVGGLGGGSVYGIAYYCYNEQYWDTGAKLTYSREVGFHEFGHCMGYSHESSMTYGNAWTVLCQEMVNELGSAGELPVSNSKWDSNYP